LIGRDLGDNNLNGPIDPGIGNLTSLQQLVLDNNHFANAALPPTIKSLKALKYMYVPCALLFRRLRFGLRLRVE
jgi:hypothetical protein